MGNSGTRPLDLGNMRIGVLRDLIARRTMRAKETLRVSSAVMIGTCLVLSCVVLGSAGAAAQAAPPQSAASAQAKAVGEIRSIGGGTLTLATDDGKSISVSLPDGVHVVRIPPGATDLKNATAISVQDLQSGDRVLVRGKASEDGKSLAASAVIVMKQSDVAAKQQQEREDWQKRGIGGLVSEVDPSAGTVTISVTSFAGSKKVSIQTTKKTVVRRYAANSVKFDDAKPSKLADIHPGDQLRARGTKNADGTEFTAEEIVSGSFRNIAGTVTSANAADNSLTVMDLLSKKAVVVKVTPDSQLRKLTQMMAQRIAMRLKGQTPEGQAPAGGTAQGARGQGPPGAGGAPGGGVGRGGAGGDLGKMLLRLPAVTVADFQKGDAVILVSTEGSDSGVTAITMVGGVEPILTAGSGSQMVLSPWSLGGGGESAAQ